MKADRYGVVTLEGRHRYSADRANAGRGVIVGLRALEVEVLDSSGKHLATHPRAYGQASTNSEDPSMQLALLCVFCQVGVGRFGVSFSPWGVVTFSWTP